LGVARARGDASSETTVIVGGGARAFAGLVAPALGQALLSRIVFDQTGGLDGVTAANTFEAQANPDGNTALMVPGEAALAWLAGDPRVHFDAGLWVPALAAVAPAVLVGRTPIDRLRSGDVVRLAASSPAGCELPALLGLDLLGLRTAPVFNLRLEADKTTALRDGAVDAILLTGRDVPARLARLEAAGFAAMFALGAPDIGPSASRDPALPRVETFDELMLRATGHTPRGPLAPAFRASSAAAQLDAALVLPQLAPPGIVARWRAACGSAGASPTVQGGADAASIRPLAAPACVTAVSAVLAGETAMLDLHRFLADRFGWNPV
jgi:hypothetical protein